MRLGSERPRRALGRLDWRSRSIVQGWRAPIGPALCPGEASTPSFGPAGAGSAVTGRRQEATRLFLQIWSRLGDRELVHRLTVAHAVADLQNDPRDELTWDLLALGTADRLSDADLTEAGVGVSTRSLYPSLHLNAGEAYRKVGDLPAARVHCAKGRAALAALGSDPYGGMLIDGFARLETRIEDDASSESRAERPPSRASLDAR
jgi:hypothetical protein